MKVKDEKYINAKTGKVIVAVDPNYYRPAEVDFLCGDPRKAKKVLGWEPKSDVEALAKLMMEADCKGLGVKI